MAQYKIVITDKTEQDLQKISKVDYRRIGQKLQYFISAEDPMKFSVRLTGLRPPIYRFRVGKYRVFFDLKDGTFRILGISVRDKAYRK